MLVIFYTFYFLYVIVKENAVIIDKKSWILLVYLFIVIFGLFNAITFGPFLSLVDWDYNAIINENFISYIPKILFSILLYSYIKIKGYNYLRDNLRYLAVLISIALIIIAVYFLLLLVMNLLIGGMLPDVSHSKGQTLIISRQYFPAWAFFLYI